MIEKCGCVVTKDPKTQFETVKPCDKHDSWGKFEKIWKKYKKIIKEVI